MPIKVFRADSMLLSIGKSWEIFPIKQKFNTMTAFVDSKNYQNQMSFFQPKNEYLCADFQRCKNQPAQSTVFQTPPKSQKVFPVITLA